MALTMREAFGRRLAALGAERRDLVVLDADVSSSTRSVHFAASFPDRFFNVGVAEANLVGVAAGLALAGWRPVANAFAIFLSLKSTDQIRNVLCYDRIPVVLAGSYAGLSDSFDGASHQSLADIAIMRSLPGLTVLVPADNASAERFLELSLAVDGPVYIRICRNEAQPLPEGLPPLEIGRARVLRRGNDITIAACGICLAMALEAADRLEGEGVAAEVLDMASVKPLDAEMLCDSVSRTGRLITVEEGSIVGGLGGACAEALERVPHAAERVGVRDLFTESGPYQALLEANGICPAEIAGRARTLAGSRRDGPCR